MKYIYYLKHCHRIEKDLQSGEWICDTKRIGYFSTLEKATQIVKQYRTIQGFRDFPDAFEINRVKVDFDDYEFI